MSWYSSVQGVGTGAGVGAGREGEGVELYRRDNASDEKIYLYAIATPVY